MSSTDSFKGMVVGTLAQVSVQTIDPDKIYEVTDFPEGGITNAQMLGALTPAQNAFYRVGETFVCTDSGTYKQGCIYKFTGISWELLLDASLITHDDNASTAVVRTATRNVDDTFSEEVTSVTVTIPSTFKHGDSYGLNFKTGSINPTFTVINNSDPAVPFSFVSYGSATNSYTPKANGIISTIFVHNGLNILCYVNEV